MTKLATVFGQQGMLSTHAVSQVGTKNPLYTLSYKQIHTHTVHILVTHVNPLYTLSQTNTHTLVTQVCLRLSVVFSSSG